MSRRPDPLARLAAAATVATIAAGVVLGLAGCSVPAPIPSPSGVPTGIATPSESPAPSPTPTGPVLDQNGTAEANLPLFTSVVDAVWASPQQVQGRAYVDALVAAGFDKSAMQLTPDESTVGNPAESIQFSIRWGSECLIGQVGPATGAPFTTIVPGLEGGTCLVGRTRPIDW
ncbi:DUF6993 domain-containing protein [Microbacterium ulmi]|uniref:DUF6993 domain-containing protein n=1 Tax=Microbacterium ulmi TaxID=179095 RepID=UPI00313298FC|nr:hypothetical protein [Microbacterium ulmi]